MDRAEFQRYIDNALQEAERVRTYCTQDEIVLIMTADFYRELLATADIHANRDGDHYGFLYGYRIALINEPTERTMVSPAVLGMTYHPGMALDDIIVVDEENRVFRLTSRDPVQFTDTGMTVRVFDRLTGGGRRKKNRVKEDAELSAGDTKAMDEFLDGFAIKQNLQQA